MPLLSRISTLAPRSEDARPADCKDGKWQGDASTTLLESGGRHPRGGSPTAFDSTTGALPLLRCESVEEPGARCSGGCTVAH